MTDDGYGTFDLRYQAKSWEVQRSVSFDKKDSFSVLIREAEGATQCNDFTRVHCTTKELACGPAKNMNDRLFIEDDEQLKS